jgi:High potential iron-sulfur protein
MRATTLRPPRWRVLQAAMAVGAAALLSRAPESSAQQKPKATLKKRSKEAVGYRDEPYEGRSCAKCVLYTGHGECVLVEGEVSPNGWCLQWTPATMGRLRRHSTA